MGGFRTFFGGICGIGAGVYALLVGLLSPSVFGITLPSDNYLIGFIFYRWPEAIAYLSTYSTFAFVWIMGLLAWIVGTALLTIGSFVGFWKGGYSPLIGSILFILFDVVVNLLAGVSGLTASALGGFIHFEVIIIFIIGLFGGILQASASKD